MSFEDLKSAVAAVGLSEAQTDQAFTALTSEIVGAYVGHHTVASNDPPDLVTTFGKKLAGLGQAPVEPEEEKPTPAMPIKPGLKGFYPIDWRQLFDVIRFGRAKGHCEQCCCPMAE